MNVNDYARQYSELYRLGWPEDKFKLLFNHPVILDTEDYGFFNYKIYRSFNNSETHVLMETIITMMRNVRYSDELFNLIIRELDDINKKYVKRLKRKQMAQIKKSAKEFVV